MIKAIRMTTAEGFIVPTACIEVTSYNKYLSKSTESVVYACRNESNELEEGNIEVIEDNEECIVKLEFTAQVWANIALRTGFANSINLKDGKYNPLISFVLCDHDEIVNFWNRLVDDLTMEQKIEATIEEYIRVILVPLLIRQSEV